MAAEAMEKLTNGVKFLGDFFFLPGTSLLMDGNLGKGAGHAVLGIGSKLLLGSAAPWVVLAIAANSFSTSVVEKSLVEHLKSGLGRDASAGTSGVAAKKA
jgi:hypothetical protein